MRIPEQQIKQAILHPEQEIRDTALRYFRHTDDPTVMPVVIEAVERFGRPEGFSLLRQADRLPQSATTIDWLIRELNGDLDVSEAAWDNFRFAVSLVLANPPGPQLAKRSQEILAAPLFPAELRPGLVESAHLASWDWKMAWRAFRRLAETVRSKSDVTLEDSHRLRRYVRGLATHQDVSTDTVRSALLGLDEDRLLDWMQPWMIQLAGELRMEIAIPVIIEHALGDDDTLLDECSSALSAIGSDLVATAVRMKWPKGGIDFHMIAIEALEHIHTELSSAITLELLSAERDRETQVALGHAALAQFETAAIEPVRELVLGDAVEFDAEERDLRFALVAAATVMNVEFPE